MERAWIHVVQSFNAQLKATDWASMTDVDGLRTDTNEKPDR